MNHIYKTVWNKSKNAFDVVSEIVSGKGKSTGSSKDHSVDPQDSNSQKLNLFAAILTPLAAMLFVQTAFANVDVAAGSNTQVYNANNGVQVVDIATANAAGISHNRFVNYNVDKAGQILNNAAQTASQMSVMTELAGKIRTNANLDGSANVILNEVVGTNRSNLNGYTEVAGNKADVIIANPYGITCAGCGFINTDRTTLTTGTPNFAQDGSLLNFNVNRGDILISDKGVDASAQSLLQLLSRSIKVDGQINTQDLKVVTGANQIDANTGEIQKLSTIELSPEYAIDSTQLGGIYANRISLISTDQGVGVRSLGNMAASGSDFTLSAAGKIELNSKISAQEKLSVQNNSTTNNALNINGALTAKQVELGLVENNHFNIAVNNGSVYADNSLNVNSKQLEMNNGIIQSAAHLQINNATSINLVSSKLNSNQALNVNTGSFTTQGASELSSNTDAVHFTTANTLSIGDAATVIAQNGINLTSQNADVIVGKAKVKSLTQDLTINASNIRLDAESSALNSYLNAQNTIQIDKNAQLSSQKVTLMMANDVGIDGKSYAFDSDLTANNNLKLNSHSTISSTNSGTIKAGQELLLADQALLAVGNIADLNATNINIAGQIQSQTANINASNTFNTANSAHVFASKIASLNALSIDLKGKQLAQNINISATKNLNLGIGGNISASSLAQLNAENITVQGDINAYNANIQASNLLNVQNGSNLSAANHINAKANNVNVNGNLKSNSTDLTATTNIVLDQNSAVESIDGIQLNSENLSLKGAVKAKRLSAQVKNQLNQEQGSDAQASEALQFNAQNINTNGQLTAKSANLNAVDTLSVEKAATLATIEDTALTANTINIDGHLIARNLDADAKNALNINQTANVESDTTQLKGDTVTVAGTVSTGNAQLTANKTVSLAQTANIGVSSNLNITANDVAVLGKAKALNTTIQAANTLNIEKNAQLQSAGLAQLNAKEIAVKGQLYTKQTNVSAQNKFDLNQGAELVSSDNIGVTAAQLNIDSLVNATNAQLTAKDALILGSNAQLAVVNQADLNAEDITLNGFTNAKNLNVHANNSLVTHVDSDIRAQETADLTAQNIVVHGQILANDTSLIATQTLQLSQSAIALANNQLNLKGEDITLDGAAQADVVDINAINKLMTQQGSLIISNGNLSLDADNQVSLEGQSSAKSTQITTKGNLTTGENFFSISEEKAILDAQFLNFDGQLYAKNADITSENALTTLQNSQVNVSDTLNLVSKNAAINLAGTTSANDQNLTAFTTISTEQAALVNSLNNLGFNADSLIHGGTLYNQNGLTTTNVRNLTNNGALQSASFALNGLKNLNNAGSFLSNSNLDIATENFSNTQNSQLASNADLNLKVTHGSLVNEGVIGTVGNLSLQTTTANATMTNNATLQANKAVSITSSHVLNNVVGVINAVDQVTVNAQQVENKGNISSKDIVLTATGGTASTVKNAGIVFANHDITINADDSIENTGTFYTKSATAGAVDDTMHLTAKNIKNLATTDGSGKYGVISTSWVPFTADYLLNEGSIQVLRAIIQNADLNTKTNFDNNALNGSTDSKGFYAFWNLDAQNLGTFNNTGTLSVHLKNDPSTSALTSMNAESFNNASGASVYLGEKSSLTVNGTTDNKGTLYLEKGNVGLEFLINTGTFILDHSNGTVNDDFTNNGNLSISNESQFTNAGNLINNKEISLAGKSILTAKNFENNKGNVFVAQSTLNALGDIKNKVGSFIRTYGLSDINATGDLNNSEMIYGVDLNGSDAELNIDAKNITNDANAGILSLGKLNLNKNYVGISNLYNRGDIYSKVETLIGNSDKKINVYNYANDESLKAAVNKPTGGMLSSDGGINIQANNLTNNFAIITNTGDINIDVANNFVNETTYFGRSLRLKDDVWTTPKHQNDFGLQMTGNSRDNAYYDINGNSTTDSEGAWITVIPKTTESGSTTFDDHKDMASALVEEIWKKSTSVKSGISNSVANTYLETADPARIIANNGNVFITVGKNAENYGGKIISLGNTLDEKGSIKIIMLNDGNFTNQSIDLYDNKEYKTQYLLMLDLDGSGNRSSSAIAFIKDSTLTAYKVLPTHIDDSWDKPSVYFDNEIKKLSLEYQNNIYWNNSDTAVNTQADNVRNLILTQFKNALVLSGNPPVSSNTATGSAVISAAGVINVMNGNLKNVGIEKIQVEGFNATPTANNKSQTGGKDGKDREKCTVGNLVCQENATQNQKNNMSKQDSISSVYIAQNKSVSLGGQQTSISSTTGYSKVTIDGSKTSVTPSQPNAPKNDTQVDTTIDNPDAPKVPVYSVNKIPDVDLSLPTSKYGQYVQSKENQTEYLVESNPLYGEQSDVLGSSYLTKQLGIDPEKLLKRLGDDGYEMNLVQKQLIQMTGTGVLFANASASDQMKKLFDNATSSSKDLGLEYGKALTVEQLSKLDNDIVWMVEGTVSGQKVLIPQVYLSQKTIDGINTNGAVIEGKVATILAVDSLTNQNATIAGGTVYADVKKDINNIGGKIKGDDVILKSQEGSINNITKSYNFGNTMSDSTTFGTTAGIESNGTLILDAAKDINNIGATLKAKGDASIRAGNDINIKSLEDHTATTSGLKKGDRINDETTSIGNGTTNTNTTTHVGSTVDLGGNAAFISGGSTTISGSDVNVKGQLYAKTGGNFTLESVQDKTETKTKTSESGLGVGGGVYGSQTQETTDFEGKNKASNLNVGSLIVDSDKKVVIAGSNINIADKDSISMISGKKGVDILDGKDEERHEKKTTTTTYLKTTKGDQGGNDKPIYGQAADGIDQDKKGKAADGNKTNTNYLNSLEDQKNTQSSATAGTEKTKLGVSASAQASTSTQGEASLRLAETTTEIERAGKETSVSSNINSAGSLLISSSDGAVNVRGSNVKVDGALGVLAKELNVTTGQNKEYASRDTTVKSIGLYTEADASADASAQAGAKAGAMGVSAGASAQANAQANGTATLGAKLEKQSESTTDITHNLSSLSSGGGMMIDVQNTATFQGANVTSGGDMDIKAKDIKNLAVQDIHEEKRSSSSKLAGVYLSGSAQASASADVSVSANATDVNPIQGNASASVSASANAGVGLRVATEDSQESYKAVTNKGNTFTAGGKFSRTAENEIVDEATQVDARSIFQKAKTITDVAVSDSQTYSKNSSSHDARIGLEVSAEVGASASANASAGAVASAGGNTQVVKKPSASVGVSASYTGSIESESSKDTQAVTSKFKAKEDITSISSGDTTLNGTQFEAGGNMDFTADKLTFNAAADTHSSKSSSQNIDVSIGVGIDVTGTPDVDVGVGYGQNKTTSNSSSAVVGGLNAGGNITINSKNADFEGTTFASGGDTTIRGETVNLKAAKNTSSSSSTGFEVGASFGNSQGMDKSDPDSKVGKDVVGRSVTHNGAAAPTNPQQEDVRQSGGVSGSFDLSNSSSTKFKGSDVSTGGTFTVESSKGGTMENVQFADGNKKDISSNMNTVTKKDQKSGFELGGEGSLDSNDLRQARNVKDAYANPNTYTKGGPLPTTTETLKMSSKEESFNQKTTSIRMTDILRSAKDKVTSIIPQTNQNSGGNP